MNFRTKLYPFFWLLLALIINGSGLSSLYAQNTEFEKLFEEAAEQQYNKPQKSLDLYRYLLKTDLDKEAQFSVYLEQLHTYQILAQYKHVIEVKQALDKLVASITNHELLFRYWLEMTFVYYHLDFPQEALNCHTKLKTYFASLSDKQKYKNQKYLDYVNVLFETSNQEADKIKKYKAIEAEWVQDGAKYAWLTFELAELYFDKDQDSSLIYFNKVLEIKNHLLNPIAQVYKDWIQNKTIDDAVVSLEVLENENLQYELKIALLTRLIFFWKDHTQTDKLFKYTEELDKIKQESVLAKRQAKVLLLENIYYTNRDLVTLEREKEKRQQLLIIFILSSSLLVFVIFRVYLKKKSIKKSRRVHEKEGEKNKLIPIKTEKEILKRLEAFEHSTLFLDKQLRLATLAKHLETNTRYLSLILNEKKNKSFNNYINYLRINYIIDKLNNDAIYLNYKISYLAEESGFASQSSFSTSFKEVAGMSPSAYIKNISDKGTA